MTELVQKSDIQATRHGSVAVLKFDVEPINAVRPKTMSDLCRELDVVRDDPQVRAVVLGHTGRHFVAGADFAFLESLKGASAQQVRDDIYRHFQGAVRAVYDYPKPVVAAIGGAAITVGCEIALACDFRVVGPRARFQESWINLGLIPPLGGLKTLAATIGYGRAADMILRGQQVGGAEAVRIGLAHQLVDDDANLEQAALTLATELASAPPLAYQAAKAGMRRALEGSLAETFAASVSQQALLVLSQDFREGVEAAVQRRKPSFKGR